MTTDWHAVPSDMGFPSHLKDPAKSIAGVGIYTIDDWFSRWIGEIRIKDSDDDDIIDLWTALLSNTRAFEDEQRGDEKLDRSFALKFSRYLGCLIGLAVGDAMGAPVECQKRGTFEVKSMTEVIGKRRAISGMYTDDTSLALCQAYSLIKCDKFDIRHAAKCFAYWFNNGVFHPTHTCFGIGRTTRIAIKQYMRTLDPYSGLTDPKSAGNGSLMRLAPIPMYYGFDLAEVAVKYSGLSSRTTHCAEEAVDCCRYYGWLLYAALNGLDKSEILDTEIWDPQARSHANGQENTPTSPFFPFEYFQEHPLCPSVRQIACGSYKRKSIDQISSSGYVMHSMEAALWGFYNSSSFREGMLKVVNLGDDTDTVGAIFGQLAGAHYSEMDIPLTWIKALTDHEHFYSYGQHLFIKASRKLVSERC